MLWRSPSPSAMLTNDAPPWEMNGSGMPVMGMIPMTIPRFTTSGTAASTRARREHRPERVARPPAAGQDPPQERAEQQEQQDRAHEPELLDQHGGHEVALLDRQVLAAVLRPVREPGAQQTARAHRDLRLDELPARALDVAGGSRNETRRSFW